MNITKIVFQPDGSLVVELSNWEQFIGFLVGLLRRLFAVTAGFKMKHGGKVGYGVQEDHGRSASSECATSKALNLYWPFAIGETTQADVGGWIEVRCPSAGGGVDLCVNSADPESDPFVLVLAKPPYFVLRGWAYGHEVRQKGRMKTKRDGSVVWFLAPIRLRPMSELFDLVKQEGTYAIRPSFGGLDDAHRIDDDEEERRP
jgi:hypothetical protein